MTFSIYKSLLYNYADDDTVAYAWYDLDKLISTFENDSLNLIKIQHNNTEYNKVWVKFIEIVCSENSEWSARPLRKESIFLQLIDAKYMINRYTYVKTIIFMLRSYFNQVVYKFLNTLTFYMF
jgi:hypothetical protein